MRLKYSTEGEPTAFDQQYNFLCVFDSHIWYSRYRIEIPISGGIYPEINHNNVDSVDVATCVTA